MAETYRDQFAEILVDEYQDTNRVQETILQSIKQGDEADGNLFMVGDVKQSIYKFRQAILDYSSINTIVLQLKVMAQDYVSTCLKTSVLGKKSSRRRTICLNI